MKNRLCLLAMCILVCNTLLAQQAITAVNFNPNTAATSTSYASGGQDYQWGVAPNNQIQNVTGFTASGISYSYASYFPGIVKIRRVDNIDNSGNFTLAWSEGILENGGNTIIMNAAYETDMEDYFGSRTYNKGTDNLFDNISTNSNNIERLDWIYAPGFSSSSTSQFGFAVFERGNLGQHDAFKIAAITGLDGSGNPNQYSQIVSVSTSDYGDISSSSVTYNILKGAVAGPLLVSGGNDQERGAVLTSLTDLGIATGQTIYGYSLFADDLPVSATPADLVDFTNPAFFPNNTQNEGGIDLIAITGVYVESSILAVKLLSFSADLQNGISNLKWTATNENTVSAYAIERGIDGTNFKEIGRVVKGININTANNYAAADDVKAITANVFFYRLKQLNTNGGFEYSNTIKITNSKIAGEISIYPNPVTNLLHATYRSIKNETISLKIYSASGSVLRTQKFAIVAGVNTISVNNVISLPKGEYWLVITNNEGRLSTEKFVKN